MGFYLNILSPSTCFYIFEQWNLLLEKCGENSKMESFRLIFLINNIFEALIKRNLDLEGYGYHLKKLTLLLNKIDYSGLLFENNLQKDIMKKLEVLLASLS